MSSHRDIGLLLVRIGVGIIFLSAGLMKLMNPSVAASGFFGFGTSLFWLVAIVETLGGLSMILGYFTRYTGVALAIISAVAFFSVNLPQGFMAARLDMMLFFAALAVAFSGPGSYAIGKQGCGCSDGICPCPTNGTCDCSCDGCGDCKVSNTPKS